MLPKLIFCENHWDPITGKILENLTLKLKALGYDGFYDEMAPSITLDDELASLEYGEKLWYLLSAKLKSELGIDLANPESLNHDYFQKGEGKITVNFIKRHNPNLTYTTFLQKLKTNNFTYQGVDLEIVKDESLSSNIIIALDPLREKHMVEAYLATKQSVFGRTGLAHALGLQKNILKQLSPEDAAQNFHFFNIYSQPALPDANYLEARVRSGKSALPLGITPIDARNHSVDEIADMVIKIVQQKQQELNKKEDSLAIKPENVESKPNIAASKTSTNASSFFGATDKKRQETDAFKKLIPEERKEQDMPSLA